VSRSTTFVLGLPPRGGFEINLRDHDPFDASHIEGDIACSGICNAIYTNR
jgi:hypothetical protein